MKGYRFKVHTRLFLISLIITFIITSVFVVFYLLRIGHLAEKTTELIYKEKIRGDLHSLHKYIAEHYGSIILNDDLLYDAKDNLIEVDFALVDKIKRELNIDASIFIKQGLDFTRISTTLRDEQGNRVLNTKLDTASEAYNTIITGRSYIGKTEVFGVIYITGFLPLFSVGNETVGLIVIGITIEDTHLLINHFIIAHKTFMIWITIFCFIAFTSMLYCLLRITTRI